MRRLLIKKFYLFFFERKDLNGDFLDLGFKVLSVKTVFFSAQRVPAKVLSALLSLRKFCSDSTGTIVLIGVFLSK